MTRSLACCLSTTMRTSAWADQALLCRERTLRLVVPHISYCLKNLYSTHEDVEIGRCIRKFANISCTWAYEVKSFNKKKKLDKSKFKI